MLTALLPEAKLVAKSFEETEMKRVTKFGISQGKVKKMAGGGLPADRYSGYGSGSLNLNKAAVNRGLTGLKNAGMAALTFSPYTGAKALKGGMMAKAAYDALDQQSRASEEATKNEQQGPTAKARGGKIKSKMSKYASGGQAKPSMKPGRSKFAAGGSVGGSYRKQADGVAHKGKTKGKMVKMRYGGKC